MEKILIGGIMGFAASFVLFFTWWRWKNNKIKGQKPSTISWIEEFRSVGELVVFKIVTKEIVRVTEHWFGEWGKEYLHWLASEKKMAMIFEFEIDFRYNLRSPDFIIQAEQNQKYRLKMPNCFYDIRIRDISIYDEQSPKLLPWLLPDLINRVFGSGFNESAKNQLIEEARQQAGQMANTFLQKMESDIRNSATQTLKALAKGFGVKDVTIDFSESELIEKKIELAA
jgi:hypothetical protein